MRINDLFLENNKVDEITLGGTAHSLGNIAGKAHGAWDAAKAGYRAGRTTVAGDIPGTGIQAPAPTTSPTTPTSSSTSAQLKSQIDAAYKQGLKDGQKKTKVAATPATVQPSAAQQMTQTQQANAQAAQADAELVAAVKAAKAKPPFQQTSLDKLTIKKGVEKGIHEAKFRSNFLNLDI